MHEKTEKDTQIIEDFELLPPTFKYIKRILKLVFFSISYSKFEIIITRWMYPKN
jgi:hypothetical protein